jgi:hypothetical protein
MREEVLSKPTRMSFSQPGKAGFDWAILCSALALLFPVAAIVGIASALHSRHAGYSRWRIVFVMAIWSGFLGIMIRGLLGAGVFP